MAPSAQVVEVLPFRGLDDAHDPPLGMPPSRSGLRGIHSDIVRIGRDEHLAYSRG